MNLFVRTIAMISFLGGIMVNLLAGDPGQKRKIELPVPIGHEVKGLHVPVRNAKGQMQLQLDTESATRLDNSNIQMCSVSIQTFDEETAKPDFKIELKTANLNTDTNIISSDKPVLVTRSDFVLTGDSMEFNRDTNQGIMKGNVRMLVYNRQEFQTKSQISGRQQ